MNITIVCDVLGKENNGTTIAAMNLIRSLKGKGHRVTVVCPDAERRGEEGFVVVQQMNFGIFNGYVAKNGVTIAKPDSRVLEKAIIGADVVHLVTPFFLANLARKVADMYGVPVTASFHCQAENITNHLFLMNFPIINTLVYKFLYRTTFRYCSAIHYPTEFIRDVFERAAGEKTNAYVISNGVNNYFKPERREKPASLKDKYVVVFTGRYSKEKSHKVLIDGVACSKYRDKIQLVFAGSGPMEEKLKRYAAKKLPVQPIFKFFSRKELTEILSYGDLYVHPAEIEIEAIACLEAITCGMVPLIANSPRSATRFFALGENNLFDYNQPYSLAKKMDWWIEHPEERDACAREYLGYAKQFNQDECMDRMEKMLLDVVRGEASIGEESYILP